jgi:predicted RNase H-like HicB family nuclease
MNQPRRRSRSKVQPKRKPTGEFHVVIERDEAGNLVASVPGLHGCHTQARTMDQLLKRVREAIAVCLEDEGQRPSSEFVGIQRIAMAS